MDAKIRRRNFLKTAGLGTAGLGLLGRTTACAAAAAPPRNANEKPFVEAAIATICTDGFSNKGHKPAFELIPKIGVKNVEFNVWFPNTITPAYRRGLRQRCSAAGLKPVCVQGSAFGGDVLKDVGHKTALAF